jgi:hypothetical protein
MIPSMGEPQWLGQVEVDGDLYLIFEADIEHYRIVRSADGHCVGRFRGSPTSMWLLEPDEVSLDVVRSIVESAIVDGIIIDTPSD